MRFLIFNFTKNTLILPNKFIKSVCALVSTNLQNYNKYNLCY